MSILRRLLISITVAMGVILLGTLGLSVTSARNYLSDQLLAQSNETAVSLALSLSQPGNDDPVIQELLVSALFDGGRFAAIELSDPEDKPLVSRRMESAVRTSAPGWFRALMPLSARSATHTVSDGWRQIGKVTITADDSYAWETLWRSSLRMIALVLGAGLLWALFALILVRWIKKRLLSDVSRQLLALGQGQLDVQPATSQVAEFSEVTDALNQTREQLRMTAEERNSKIEQLEVELNRDPVTGLANRKYFFNALRQTLASDGEPVRGGLAGHVTGHVLVFRIRDLAAINRHMPREFVDQWLRVLCARLAEVLLAGNSPGTVLARLNGSDFALLLPQCETPSAMMLAERLRTELRMARIPVGDEGDLCQWVQALTDYTAASPAGDILTRLDNALMRAESAGSDHVNFVPDDGPAGEYRGEHAWKDTLRQALEARRFGLDVEMLRDCADTVLAHEATLVLITDKGERMPATLFIPPAVRLGMAGRCDLEAIRLGCAWLQQHAGTLTIRLSLPSLREPGFLEKLRQTLAEHLSQPRRLTLEIDAHGLVEQHADVQALCELAEGHGVEIGLRRLAHQLGALTRLHGLPVRYVKLGGGFVAGMTHNPGSQALLHSVLEIARARHIDVYAEAISDVASRDFLNELGVICVRVTEGRTAFEVS